MKNGFISVRLDLQLALLSLLMDLALFGPDKGSFVDVRVNLDI